MKPIVLVGEAFGEQEETLGRPFVGPSGIALIDMLAQAGVITLTSNDRANRSEYWKTRNPYFTSLIWDAHPEVYLTNVFNLRPRPANDVKNLCGPRAEGIKGYPAIQQGKYVDGKYQPEVDRLFQEIATQNPNVVVALGATPSWALLKTSGIKSIRGATANSSRGSFKTIPTYHPAAVLRDWSLRPIVLADLAKALRESAFPEVRRPQREVWIEPVLEDLEYFSAKYIMPSPELSVDIETVGNMITCVGFAPSIDRALVIPFYDATKPGKNYWPSQEEERVAWRFVAELCSRPCARFVGQNFLFDLHFLWRSMGIPVPSHSEDSMLLHHALQPELQKGLGFLGSIYTEEASWKLMRGKSETIKRED